MWFLYLYDFKLFLGHVRQKVELLWCLGSRSPGGLGQTAVFHISISYFTFFFEIVTTWLFGGKHFFFRLRQDWKIQIKPDLLIASCSRSFVLFHANFLIKDFTGLLHLTNLIERAYFHFCRKIDCRIWLIITLCLWPCVVVFIKQSFGSFIHSSETFP